MTITRTRWFVMGLVLLGAFVALGMFVAVHPTNLDSAIADALRGEYDRPLGKVVAWLTDLFGPIMPYAFALGLIVQGVRKRDPLYAKLLGVLAMAGYTATIAKPMFDRARPREYPDLSYPSGHVGSVASTGFVAVLLCVAVAPRLVKRIAALFAVATVLSAVFRIILGVHWFTDTVGAVVGVLGVGLLAAAAVRLLPGAGVTSQE
ncbi:phosphatase PAP2 family protein [Amycolatopsis sp. cg5]|uniref:phosphatase PAP2 family protein n=1 Tax=Amycolatopsis sp. cg5 TaxID=3238802 RepID=UPI0035234233